MLYLVQYNAGFLNVITISHILYFYCPQNPTCVQDLYQVCNTLSFMCCVVPVHQMACEKLLDVVSGLVPPTQVPAKTPEDQGRVKAKTRKGN